MAGTEERRFPRADPQLVYELARDRLSSQLAQVDALDGKIVSFLGLGSGLLGVLAAFVALREDVPPERTLALVAAAGLVYALLAAVSLSAYSPRRWEVGPNLDQAWQYTAQFELPIMYWWAAEAFKDQYARNKSRVQDKIGGAKLCEKLMVLEAVLLTAGVTLVALA